MRTAFFQCESDTIKLQLQLKFLLKVLYSSRILIANVIVIVIVIITIALRVSYTNNRDGCSIFLLDVL